MFGLNDFQLSVYMIIARASFPNPYLYTKKLSLHVLGIKTTSKCRHINGIYVFLTTMSMLNPIQI